MGSNPVEVRDFLFFRVNWQLLKLQLPVRRSYFHLNLICLVFISSANLRSDSEVLAGRSFELKFTVRT